MFRVEYRDLVLSCSREHRRNLPSGYWLSARLSARTDPDPSCYPAPLAASPTSSVDSATKTIMAPRLAPSQLVMIRHIFSSKSLTTSQMAEAAGCSKRLIITISASLRMFGDIHAPLIPGGRPRTVTPVMLPVWAVINSLFILYLVYYRFLASVFSASIHPTADVADESPGSTHFHTTLDEEVRVLILIYLHEIEAIFESHIACFGDIVPESLVTHP